ncbi:ATP-dependent DNA helicase, partial [Lactobacillus acidophilus]|nr:ATP-dependent DNA helicase [Lactobacillus acidophilus]
ALMDILTNEKIITRQVIETYAKKHLLDPFEFSLDVSNFCDLIICDYNYLFDPLVKLQRFFTEKNYGYTFLIDEAHNLIDRSRAMYTKEFSSEEVKNLLDKLHSLPQPPQEVVNKLSTLLNAFDLIKEPLLNYQQQDVIIEEKLSSITKKLMYFCDFVT